MITPKSTNDWFEPDEDLTERELSDLRQLDWEEDRGIEFFHRLTLICLEIQSLVLFVNTGKLSPNDKPAPEYVRESYSRDSFQRLARLCQETRLELRELTEKISKEGTSCDPI